MQQEAQRKENICKDVISRLRFQINCQTEIESTASKHESQHLQENENKSDASCSIVSHFHRASIKNATFILLFLNQGASKTSRPGGEEQKLRCLFRFTID